MQYRLKEFMDEKSLNAREFSERIGVQPSSVSHILTGRNKPSLDFLEKVLDTFPDIDLKYWITGKKQTETTNIVHETRTSVNEEFERENTGKQLEKKHIITNVTDGNEVVEVVKFFKNGTFELFRQKMDG